MNKKISIIGTVGLPAKYGGFETLTEYLTINLCSTYDITVYCSAKYYKDRRTRYNNVHLKYINLNANGVQSIFYDILSILEALKFSDTLLILGVSGGIVLPFIRLFSKKRIIVNIDGLEWKRGKWSKIAKYFLKFSEKMAVKFSNVIVADNKVIQDYVKSEYNKNSVLIPYGSDHVTKEILNDNLRIKYAFLNEKYAFNVCRIEPENNIHIILKAFNKYSQLNLIIVGNWDNSDYGIKLKDKYSDVKNIYLLDPIYDQKVLNQIRSNCFLYIHGHSAGGTNPSLVEAMYLELPILAYNISYNKETTENKSLYFNDSNDIIRLLQQIDNKKLKSIATNMQVIANKNYTWKNISKQYSEIF